jgi:acyl-CoA synthetase (AMP-forming)/AMP-acid ligase II
MQYNLADLFESVVDAVPERTALVCEDRRLTYSRLDERANRLAHFLSKSGILPGEHVGLYMYNGTEYVESMLAALKVRAVPINVNYRYVEEELHYLFDDADLVAVVHHREFAPRIARIAKNVPKLRSLIVVDDESGEDCRAIGSVPYERALEEGSEARDFPSRSPDDLFIIYTGGTTGMPKGVMWRQEDLFFAGLGGGNPNGPPVQRPEEVAENAKSREPIVQMPVPPLIHGAAQLGTFIGFFWGGKVVLVPRFDPVRIWKAVERERVNTISIVGDAMARPLAEALSAPGASYDTSSLMVMSSAGAIFSEAVREQLRAKLGSIMLFDSFGSTETGFQGMGTESGAKGLRFRMNTCTSVLDKDLRPVEPGSGKVGRVALSGRVPLGYFKDGEKTARTFVEIDGVRWALGGDLATVEADGTITVLGRGTFCINSGGEKIFPEEVEATLKGHPDVFDAVVVGVPDERWGERVAAVVQPRPGRSPTLAELDKHCRAKIAGYKVPRQLCLVDKILRSPSGKPDYPWAKAAVLASGR